MKTKFILSPSLLSCDFANIEKELKGLEEAKIKWVHWDVMDGHFVPNITLGPVIIKKCRPKSSLFFDVHLMIENPERYLMAFKKAGADLLCVHAEACIHLDSVISQISELGVKPAVALNPHTPIEIIKYILPKLYMVLIMSVNPGFGGQKFIPYTVKKVKEIRQMIDCEGLDTLIQVDGGVSLDNAKDLVNAGANVLVSGSAFFNYPPYDKRHKEFLDAISKK
ncbi:ribulose-phosphate 3-epimerase [Desulfothermus okinawensis JCM 13304]